MEILFNGDNTKKYYLMITYYYFVGGEIKYSSFDTLSKFEEFMAECHPGISIAKFVEKFNSELAKLNERTYYDFNGSNVNLNCGICGDELFASKFTSGVMEKMWEYKNARDKANDGYINTILCNSWSYNMDTGIMRIKYWYDPNDNTLPVYKIHVFKDKVMLEMSNGKPHSIIVTSDFYVHCEGTKKVS